jgi:hypothetical protein
LVSKNNAGKGIIKYNKDLNNKSELSFAELVSFKLLFIFNLLFSKLIQTLHMGF